MVEQATGSAGWKRRTSQRRDGISKTNRRPGKATYCSELADRDDPEENGHPGPRITDESNFQNHIFPRWGELRLNEVRTIAIQDWLRGLKKNKGTQPMARGTKAKIRNIMHILFAHAMRYEFIDRNPVTGVRQSARGSRRF